MRSAFLATLVFCLASTAHALPGGWSYENGQAPPAAIDAALNALLSDPVLEARLESAREVEGGFEVVLHHSSCSGVTLNAVITAVSSSLQNQGLEVSGLWAESEPNVSLIKIVVQVQAAPTSTFLLTEDDYYPACFNYTNKKAKDILDLWACCGYDWRLCDGELRREACEECGGRQVGGICVTTLQPD